MVSIAGNIGLLRLSALCRRLQEILRSGASLNETDLATLSEVAAQARAQIDELQSTPSPAS